MALGGGHILVNKADVAPAFMGHTIGRVEYIYSPVFQQHSFSV